MANPSNTKRAATATGRSTRASAAAAAATDKPIDTPPAGKKQRAASDANDESMGHNKSNEHPTGNANESTSTDATMEETPEFLPTLPNKKYFDLTEKTGDKPHSTYLDPGLFAGCKTPFTGCFGEPPNNAHDFFKSMLISIAKVDQGRGLVNTVDLLTNKMDTNAALVACIKIIQADPEAVEILTEKEIAEFHYNAMRSAYSKPSKLFGRIKNSKVQKDNWTMVWWCVMMSVGALYSKQATTKNGNVKTMLQQQTATGSAAAADPNASTTTTALTNTPTKSALKNAGEPTHIDPTYAAKAAAAPNPRATTAQDSVGEQLQLGKSPKKKAGAVHRLSPEHWQRYERTLTFKL